LIAFDLKGAFKRVNYATIDARLREKLVLVPSPARAWIWCFMQDGMVSIHVNGYTTAVAPVEHAGLAQRSLLSPILSAFFDADPVHHKVNTQGGASAYVDDYFPLGGGPLGEGEFTHASARRYPAHHQMGPANRLVLLAEKTQPIHSTRRRKELCVRSVNMDRRVIQTGPVAKLLGGLINQELSWKDHVQRAVKQATVVALAISGLRHMRPV